MDDTEFTEFLSRAYKNAPQDVQNFLGQGRLDSFVTSLDTELGFGDRVVGAVTNEVLMLLLKITPSEEFLANLKRIEGLDAGDIALIVSEVDRQIFGPLLRGGIVTPIVTAQTKRTEASSPVSTVPKLRKEPEKDPEHLLPAHEETPSTATPPTPPKPVVPAAALNRSAPPKFAPRPQVRTMKTDVEAVKKPTIPAIPQKPVVPKRPTAPFVPFAGKPTPPTPPQTPPSPASEAQKPAADPYREPIE